MGKSRIIPIPPEKITTLGVEVLERNLFYDERGFLIETFAASKEKDKSNYSYISLTQPGFARDVDRFHYHLKQKDRFTIVFGKMWILLSDQRKKSPTFGKVEVVEARGGDPKIKKKTSFPVWTITIPEGVYHGIKNPGPSLAILVNHPTVEYNPKDEGRVLFTEIAIPFLGGKNFSWELIKR